METDEAANHQRECQRYLPEVRHDVGLTARARHAAFHPQQEATNGAETRVGVDVVLPPRHGDQRQRHGDWPHVGELLATALKTDGDWPDENEA